MQGRRMKSSGLGIEVQGLAFRAQTLGLFFLEFEFGTLG